MPTDPSLSYESLASSDDPAFAGFMGIYRAFLAVREQKPEEIMGAMVARPEYRFLLLKRSGRTIGFSVVFVSVEQSFCLLEYMAIHAGDRNAGFGGRLFLRTVQEVAAAHGEMPMLLEVDSDRESAADLDLRRRRIQFYRRLGCLRVDGFSYILPLAGIGPPPEMDLMVHLPKRPCVMSRSLLERGLQVIYEEVYDCAPGDPRISVMMKRVSDPVRFV